MSVDYDAGGAKQKGPLLIFLGLVVASIAALPLLPPIPQDQGYHRFADVSAWWGHSERLERHL
jgi:hypothetical protein